MRFNYIKSGVKLIILVTSLFNLHYDPLLAQSKTSLVKGMVESTSGKPVPGVSVVIKNSKTNFASGTNTSLPL